MLLCLGKCRVHVSKQYQWGLNHVSLGLSCLLKNLQDTWQQQQQDNVNQADGLLWGEHVNISETVQGVASQDCCDIETTLLTHESELTTHTLAQPQPWTQVNLSAL